MSSQDNNVDVGFKWTKQFQVTDKMVRQFAEMSGDFNPIHVDEEFAAKTRFKRRIAHGMIVGALFSRCLVESLGHGGVYLGQNMKFVTPVFIDDIIEVSIEVTGLRKEKGIATVETLARKISTGEFCVKGEAVIMLTPPV